MVHQSFDETAAGCNGIIIYLLTDIARYLVYGSQQKRRIICQRYWQLVPVLCLPFDRRAFSVYDTASSMCMNTW